MDTSAPSDLSLYTLLSLTPDATPIELKRAFRSLSQRYHPDKHPSEPAKAAATEHFTKVKEAYELLSDPKLRKVYDDFGLAAARVAASAEMEMVPYADLAERFRSDPSANQSSSTPRDAYFTVSNVFEPRIDATGLIVALEDPVILKDSPVAVVSQVAMSLMATAYVTQKHTVAVRYSGRGEGRRTSRTASGVGELAASWRTQLDPYSSVEATAYVPLEDGRRINYGAKIMRALSDDTTVAYEATADPAGGAVTSALTCARSFDNRCTASTSWSYGAVPVVAFTWKRNAYDEYAGEEGGKEENPASTDQLTRTEWIVDKIRCLVDPMGWRWTARLNGMDMSLGFVIRRPVGEGAPLWKKCMPRGEGGASLKVRGQVGMMGWEVEVGGGKKYVVADTSWGTSVAFGSVGVVWRLKVSRSGHRLVMPVVLVSSGCDAKIATATMMVTGLVVAAVEGLLITPWRMRRRREEREEAKKRRTVDMEQAKKEAKLAVDMMNQTLERTLERERAVEIEGRNGCGLLIEKAVYGLREALETVTFNEKVEGKEIELELADVTKALQGLVENSALQIVSSTKSTLNGFWDPTAFGDKEELAVKVWYKFRGEKHECIVADNEALELPLSSHRVSAWT